ncbi:hypothetical protein RFI_10233, partial [Reticulomyxa filosa]
MIPPKKHSTKMGGGKKKRPIGNEQPQQLIYDWQIKHIVFCGTTIMLVETVMRTNDTLELCGFKHLKENNKMMDDNSVHVCMCQQKKRNRGSFERHTKRENHKKNGQPKETMQRSKTQKDVVHANKHTISERALDSDLSDDENEDQDEKIEAVPIGQDRAQLAELGNTSHPNVIHRRHRNSDETDRYSGILKKAPDLKFQSDTLYQPKPKT